MKKILQSAFRLFLILIGSIVLYLLLAFVGTLVPISAKETQDEKNIPIFVISNGFHTDLIIPLQNPHFDWLSKMDTTGFEQYQNYKYLALGWGDKGFFMESFNNQFPSLATTLNAAFIPSESLMHLAFYQNSILENECTIKRYMSEDDLKNLITFVEKSFQLNKNKKFIFYSKGYGYDDFFFKANGYYHLFNTCNQWTNEGLAEANQPASLWSPFAQGIIWRVR